MSYFGKNHTYSTNTENPKLYVSTTNMGSSSNREDVPSKQKSNQRYGSRSRSRSHSRDNYRSSRKDERYKSYTGHNSSDYHLRNKLSRSRSRSPKRNHKRSRHDSRDHLHKYYSRSSSQSSTERSCNINTDHKISETVSAISLVSNSHAKCPPVQSVFKNDGSFLEMFKKMQEQGSLNTAQEQKSNLMPLVGRRRGGKVLKTGIVEKIKPTEDCNESNKPKDPWSIYINEVKKYRQSSCQDEGKTRSLVK